MNKNKTKTKILIRSNLNNLFETFPSLFSPPESTCNEMKYNYVIKKNNLPTYFRFNIQPVHENHICALNTRTGGDACSGDSGGPLMYKNPQNNRWYLVGVVSGAWDLCGVDRGVPGLYTNISPYRSTIQQSADGVCVKPY